MINTEREEINELKRRVHALKIQNERLSLEKEDLKARLIKVYRYCRTGAFEENHNRLTVLAQVRELTQNFK